MGAPFASDARAASDGLVCGMDEVGRGALAGPLVAAAVILRPDFQHPLLRDSKRLSPTQRQRLDPLIRAAAVRVMVVEVSAAEIDRRGVGWANRSAFEGLLAALDANRYVVDGNLRLHTRRAHQTLIGGDDIEPSISAASIVAKVHRDHLMAMLDRVFPGYEWTANKGYGSSRHLAAIRELGTTPQHRLSFIHGEASLPF